jgi:hypothetical protein
MTLLEFVILTYSRDYFIVYLTIPPVTQLDGV